ncbi:MAG: KH domain-containing protein [Spirochaetaceae bacterium]|nr:KH domain-containing protein [Spirochaetaceae bacterium]
MEKELIDYIAKSLVDDPSSVSVDASDSGASLLIRLNVGENDIGKVIGKHGRIIKAIRTVLQAATAKSGKRAVLELVE